MSDKVIEMLAAKLGVAANVLWAALIRQAPISGISDIIFDAFLLCAILALAIVTPRIVRWVNEDFEHEIVWIPLIIAWVVLTAVFVSAVCSLPLTIASFYNPQYWALHELLHAATSK